MGENNRDRVSSFGLDNHTVSPPPTSVFSCMGSAVRFCLSIVGLTLHSSSLFRSFEGKILKLRGVIQAAKVLEAVDF